MSVHVFCKQESTASGNIGSNIIRRRKADVAENRPRCGNENRRQSMISFYATESWQKIGDEQGAKMRIKSKPFRAMRWH